MIQRMENFFFSSDNSLDHSRLNNQKTNNKLVGSLNKNLKFLKLFYGHISLKSLIQKARKYPGFFAKNFFALLEQRLDVVLYRSGFVKTLFQARQLGFQNKIKVNSVTTKSLSRSLQPGDIVQLSHYLNTISHISSNESYNEHSSSIKFISKKNELLLLISELLYLKSQNKKINNVYYRNLLFTLLKDSDLNTSLLKQNLLHIEASNLTNQFIYLYSPQRLLLPFQINTNFINKSK